ncbi:MAG: CHASE domain-containing protein, partial [Gammaproteobacteria bacterium]|nr:CHASE domain-containing protein [Gammaproteobacteria bacterium]
LIVLLGWLTHNEKLIQVLPSYTPMQFNTALSFILCGIGLLAQLYNKSRIAVSAGIMVVGIGSLTILEYATNTDLHIDQIFMDHYITTNSLHPGRMAPSTAITFILSGIAIMFSRCALFPILHYRISGILGTLVASIGIGTIFGYMLGTNTPYGWSHLTHMAIHTSAGVTVLGLGILLLSYNKITKSNNPSQKWLALAAGIGAATLAIALWQTLLTQDRHHINAMIAARTSLIHSKIQNSIEQYIKPIIRLGKRWEFRNGTPIKEWESDVTQYIEHHPGYQAIGWADSSFHVRWIVPLEENKQALNLDLTFEDSRRDTLMRAHKERKLQLTHSIDLIQGDKGFIAYIPLFPENGFDGFMTGVFRINKLLDPLIQNESLSKGYHISIFEGDELLYRNQNSNPLDTKEWEQESIIKLYNITWKIRVSPTQRLLASKQSSAPSIALGIGLLVTLLLSLTINRIQSARLHAKAFEKANKELEDEVNTRKKIEYSLHEYKENLEELVDERTTTLKETNLRLLHEINDRRSTEKALQKSEKQLRDLARHLESIREEERKHIAREVHDEVGQLLTALSMDAHWVIKHCPDNNHILEEKALSMLPNIESAIIAVQRIVSELRPAILDDLGLVAAINWYCEQFQTRTGVTCELNMSLDNISVDTERSTAIFRILQETLTNVTRHAHATRVTASMGIDDHTIYMRITDNGIGISDDSLNANDAFGLIGMRERALALAGSIVIERNNDSGTTVNLLLPIYCDINATDTTSKTYERKLL